MVVSNIDIPCPEWGKVFKKKNLQSHISAVHRISVSNCKKCGKGFKNPEYLRNHVNKVHKVETVICEVCSKVCKSKANLYNHNRDVHELIENLKCNLCGELQKNYSYLSRHRRRLCKFKQKSEAKPKSKIITSKEGNENDADIQNYIKNDIVRDKTPHQVNLEEDDVSEDEMEIVTDDGTMQTIDQTKPAEETKSVVQKLDDSFGDIKDSKTEENRDDDQARNYEHLVKENEDQHDDWKFCDIEIETADFVIKSENTINENNDSSKTIKPKVNIINEDDDSSITIKLKDSKINKDEESSKPIKQEKIDDIAIETPEEKQKFALNCFKCEEVFENRKILVSHIRELHKQPEKTTCDVCHKELKTNMLKKHIQDVHTECSCDECGKVFKKRKNLNDHKRATHKEVELSPCEFCSKQFKSGLLKLHIRNVHSKQTSACNECGKIYPGVQRLQDHVRTVHNNMELFCDLCGKTFKCKSYLAIHTRRYHNAVDENLSCDHCEKVFKNKNEHYLHNYAVHTVENIPCSICGKNSRNRYTLKKHMKHNHGN